MLIFGIILIVIGVICLFMKKSSQSRLMAFNLTKTYTAADLKELFSSVAKEAGKGNFREMVELKGTLECASPLTAELSKEPCVYFKSTVEREVEETYYEQDAQTKNKVMKTRREMQLISSTERNCDFYIKDATGKIRVKSDNAEFDLIKSMEKYEPASAFNYANGNLNWGGFFIPIAENVFNNNYNMQTHKILGYKMIEYMFPVNRDTFVIGEASDSSNGEITVAKPVESKGEFIVSNKSEEQLAADAKQSAKWLDIASKVCLAIGAVLALAGLVIK
ncbi:MAG: E3 ubiquitin ligase family protein [Candidatus Wallbacteria bacterium]